MERESDRTTRYLEELHSAELGLQVMLDVHAEDLTVPIDFRQVCMVALADSFSRSSRLEMQLGRLGEDPSRVRDMFAKAAANFSGFFHNGIEPADRVTQDLIKAHTAAHLVHSSYVAFQGYSESIGEQELATLAEEGARTAVHSADSLIRPIYEAATDSARVLHPS